MLHAVIMKKYPFIIYLVTGGLNTIISLELYNLLIQFGIYYLIASGISYVFGVIEGYIFSSLWVFKYKVRFSGLIKYYVVYGISFVINVGLMYLMVSVLGLNKFMA